MYAKKSLGQHFLQSKSALQKIVDAGNVSSNDFILEIGPGKGALTEYLLAAGAMVIAVETDTEMIKFLEDKFASEIKSKKMILIKDNILKFDPSSIESLKENKYKLIANIPYYITGEIIRKFLTGNNQPEKMVLLIQKEVSDRIIARDGKESILSIATKVYCNPKFIETVKAGSFVPAPSVDSAIVLFDSISKKFFVENNVDEDIFFKILKTGFAHKRKKLFSNLKEKFNFDEKNIISNNNFNINVRAEELSLVDWRELVKNIN